MDSPLQPLNASIAALPNPSVPSSTVAKKQGDVTVRIQGQDIQGLLTKPKQNFLQKWLWGASHVSLNVQSQVVYVKVNELSKILRVDKSIVQAQAEKNKGEATKLAQTVQTYKEVQDALGVKEFEQALEKTEKFGNEHLKALAHIQKQIKYTESKIQKGNSKKFYATSLSQVFKDPRLKSDKLYATLAKVGENLKENSISNSKDNAYMAHYHDQLLDMESYGFVIDKKGHVYIEDQAIAKGGFKQVANSLRLDRSSQQDRLDGYVMAKMEAPNDPSAQIKLVENAKKEVQDIEYLNKLNMPNIVPTYKVSAQSKFTRSYALIQKKMDGDGVSLIKDKTIRPSDIFSVMLDVNQGLAAMHNYKKNQELGDGNQQVGILHNDIKPANILFKRTKAGIKGYIHDLGLMTKPGIQSRAGTPHYLCPEKHKAFKMGTHKQDPSYSTEKVDSFAVGLTIIELLTKKTQYLPLKDASRYPLGEISNQEAMDNFLTKIKQDLKIDAREKAINGDRKLTSQEKEQQLKELETEKHLLSLAADLLKFDPKDRISCEEAAKRMEAFKNNSITLKTSDK